MEEALGQGDIGICNAGRHGSNEGHIEAASNMTHGVRHDLVDACRGRAGKGRSALEDGRDGEPVGVHVSSLQYGRGETGGHRDKLWRLKCRRRVGARVRERERLEHVLRGAVGECAKEAVGLVHETVRGELAEGGSLTLRRQHGGVCLVEEWERGQRADGVAVFVAPEEVREGRPGHSRRGGGSEEGGGHGNSEHRACHGGP